MTALAIKPQKDVASAHIRPKDYLDQKAQKLAEKHQQRLETISKQALSHQRIHPPSNFLSFFLSSLFKRLLTPAPMMAVASIFVLSLAIPYFFESADKQLSSHALQVNAKLPTWVKDTEVPIALLENLDFYVWLSQYDQFAQTEDKRVLVAAGYDQHCPRQRCSPRYLTEGFSRTTSFTGAF